ncbi:MAG TPA: TIGR04282 family arsenosugar biosynthesis glycosyltransferase [Terriglobia bacterium]|nr:TIGR04282 family arsenosugar biosynthesis glycosyltransferase [Terriglobia bacterium]
MAIFARAPMAGRCKTRLIPLLGREGAAEFQRVLIADTVRKTRRLGGSVRLYVMAAGAARSSRETISFPSEVEWLSQRGADLGARIEHALRFLLKLYPRAIIIGTDSPELPPRIFRVAFEELRYCDAVLGPCPDGGYYLIGMQARGRSWLPRGLLDGVRWGSRWALRDTTQRLLAAKLSYSLLEPFEDADRPRDLQRLFQRFAYNATLRRRAPATWRFLSKGMGIANAEF